MLESVEWLRTFIFHYPSLEYFVIFLGAAIGGELGLFTLGFLVARGILPVFPLIISGFLGAFSPNILWFLIGRTKTISRMVSHRYANTTISNLTQAVTRFSRGNHSIALIIIKFLVGTPLILIMYINKTGLRFAEFLYYETPAILLSMLVILPIGFISGLGFTYLAGIFQNLYISIGFILCVIIIIMAVQLWFKKKFTKIET